MGQEPRRVRRPRFLRNLKTAGSGRIRSKPPAVGQLYLDQYTLRRDRARWSQAKERAEQMIQGIDNALRRIEPLTNGNGDRTADTACGTPTIDLRTRPRRNAET